jgi:hypothetical protein
MLKRLAIRNDEDTPPERLGRSSDTRNVHVVLGQVSKSSRVRTIPLSNRDDLGHMTLEECIELSILICRCPGLDSVTRIVVPPELLPYHLLERLRTPAGNLEPVTVGTLPRSAVGYESAREPIPQEGAEEKRHLLIRMSGEVASIGEHLKEDRRSGARESGNEHGMVSRHTSEVTREDSVFQIRQHQLREPGSEGEAVE